MTPEIERLIKEKQVLQQALIYFAECTLATVESLKNKKRSSKYEINRQQRIADDALRAVTLLSLPHGSGFLGRSIDRAKELGLTLP